MKKMRFQGLSLIAIATMLISGSCGKDDAPPADPCVTTNLSVMATSTSTSGCGSTGTVSVTASGGTGLQYKLDNGAFGTSNSFNTLGAGTFNITVKNAEGCSTTKSVTVGTDAAGTKFSNVQTLLTTKCSGSNCHGTTSSRSFNLSNECNIVNSKDAINTRAVVQGNMPPSGPLSTAEKQIITDWLAAGGMRNN
jgi:hypothetical protein